MHYPKTYLEDYKAWSANRIELLARWSKGELSRSEYEVETELLENKFKERIHQEDFKYFNTVDDLEAYLTKISEKQNKKTIEHEMVHEKRTNEKGYKYQCGLCYLIDVVGVIDFDIIVKIFSLVKNKNNEPIPLDDLVYIYSVDNKPSGTDKLMLDLLKA